MKVFSPIVYIDQEYGVTTTYVVDRYRKVLKNIRKYLEMSSTNKVTVTRYRRGQFGEWFEWWRMVDGRPEIVWEGWM